MVTVQQILQMLEEGFFVPFMSMNMGLNAAYRIVTIKKFREPKHVGDIRNSGLNIVHSIVVRL
jgi:hypothetical protein